MPREQQLETSHVADTRVDGVITREGFRNAGARSRASSIHYRDWTIRRDFDARLPNALRKLSNAQE